MKAEDLDQELGCKLRVLYQLSAKHQGSGSNQQPNLKSSKKSEIRQPDWAFQALNEEPQKGFILALLYCSSYMITLVIKHVIIILMSNLLENKLEQKLS